jgi:hypothetical protein
MPRSEPGGIFAKILRNTEGCSTVFKIAAVAIPVILSFALYFSSVVMLSSDHAFRIANVVLGLVFPVWGMYEATSLLKEVGHQTMNHTF